MGAGSGARRVDDPDGLADAILFHEVHHSFTNAYVDQRTPPPELGVRYQKIHGSHPLPLICSVEHGV